MKLRYYSFRKSRIVKYCQLQWLWFPKQIAKEGDKNIQKIIQGFKC